MHSLETGIIISIAAFFFFNFLTFAFLRETNISKEIILKCENEKTEYAEDTEVTEKRNKKYCPDFVNNILNIIVEGEKNYVGEN